MAASSNSNELLIRGVGDILESQPQSVRDNLQRLTTLRDNLYNFIGPVMPKVVGCLGSGSEEYLKYIVSEDYKKDKLQLNYSFRKLQRDRIDSSLSTVKEFIDKF